MRDGQGEREAREHEPFGEPTEEDVGRSVSEGEPYFPPTDPPTREGAAQADMDNGFASTAMDDDAEPPRPVSGGIPDEALADSVRLELEQDASTTHLELDVTVREGIATLRGRVSDLADDENALAVAGRVPGVRDVVDELEVDAAAT